jgi:hypothetical protein
LIIPLDITYYDVGTFALYSTKNIPGIATVPPSTETPIIDYLIPSTFDISDIFCIGDADGEFKIYKNGGVIAEGRTSSSNRVFHHPFSRPYRFLSGDILKITVKHYESGVEDFKAYAFAA